MGHSREAHWHGRTVSDSEQGRGPKALGTKKTHHPFSAILRARPLNLARSDFLLKLSHDCRTAVWPQRAGVFVYAGLWCEPATGYASVSAVSTSLSHNSRGFAFPPFQPARQPRQHKAGVCVPVPAGRERWFDDLFPPPFPAGNTEEEGGPRGSEDRADEPRERSMEQKDLKGKLFYHQPGSQRAGGA